VTAHRTDMPTTRRRDPREKARTHRVPHRDGFPYAFQSNGNGLSMVAMSGELAVWCTDGSFEWQQDGVVVRHPADDPTGAAELISALLRQSPGLGSDTRDDRPDDRA
jgi:hypothetical protein